MKDNISRNIGPNWEGNFKHDRHQISKIYLLESGQRIVCLYEMYGNGDYDESLTLFNQDSVGTPSVCWNGLKVSMEMLIPIIWATWWTGYCGINAGVCILL